MNNSMVPRLHEVAPTTMGEMIHETLVTPPSGGVDITIE